MSDPDQPSASDATESLAPGVAKRQRRRTVHEPFRPLDDDEQASLFLKVLRETGAYICAAEACNCNPREIQSYRREHPEFQLLCDDALEHYGTDIVRAMHTRAVQGWENPIIGGRNKDEIVAYEKKYSDSLGAMFLKKVDPSFRDKSEVKVEANVAATFDYSRFSTKARALMRQLAEQIREDDEARERGEVVP